MIFVKIGNFTLNDEKTVAKSEKKMYNTMWNIIRGSCAEYGYI